MRCDNGDVAAQAHVAQHFGELLDQHDEDLRDAYEFGYEWPVSPFDDLPQHSPFWRIG